MLHRFITRHHRYAVRQLSNGAARVYIQNADALQRAGFLANSSIRITHKRDSIEVTLDPRGENKIFETGRGELLELKNKATAQSLGKAKHVSVTFRKGRLVIKAHAMDEALQRRCDALIGKMKRKEPLRKACLFSGLGMLSYHIGEGLSRRGVRSAISFANDYDELALSCNVAGNPMWASATDDAEAIADDLRALLYHMIAEADIVTIGYPCVGFSSLAKKENLDLNHPQCGTLFISLVAVLRKLNPAVMIFENTPRFGKSTTLDLIKRSFPDYQFSEQIMDGHDFNELESRKRICIVATSNGLPAFDFATVRPLFNHEPKPQVQDYLTPQPLDAACWRTMAHVKARDNMPHLGYRNMLYYGHETEMVTLPASYGNPKAGTPMIAHPENADLQRLIQPNEHASLRHLPGSLQEIIMDVWKGRHPLVPESGSASRAHRLCGNGVSKNIWQSIGAALGEWLQALTKVQNGICTPLAA